MKKNIFFVFVSLLICTSVFGVAKQLSISDFVVHSDRADYKYMGKGISEMIAVELRKSPGIKLIERERRTDLLEEMEIALSDLADSQTQLEVGKLLAVYMVYGEIIDMGKKVLISLRMVDVESGEVIWNEKLTEKLTNYDYISGFFATSILKHIDVKVTKSTIEKTEEKVEKSQEVVIAFSRAVDYYDKKDVKTAKEELSKAKKLDPKSEAVRLYLAKLIPNTSKFKSITEQYFLAQNPAYLGLIAYDRSYLISAMSYQLGKDYKQLEHYPNLQFNESDRRFMVGYQFPIFQRMGFEVCYFNSHAGECQESSPNDDYFKGTDRAERDDSGAIIGFGWSPLETFSFGLGCTLYSQFREGQVEHPLGGSTVWYEDPAYFRQAFSGRFLLRNREATFIFDLFAGYSLEKILYFDPDTYPNTRSELEERSAPLFVESTLTLSLNERKSFLIIKQLNDIHLETGSFYGRLVPAFEHWPLEWLSVRVGVEGAAMKLLDKINWGLGGTGGFTIRLSRWRVDIDGNVTYRRRPSRVLDGEFLDEIVAFITVSKNRLFIER